MKNKKLLLILLIIILALAGGGAVYQNYFNLKPEKTLLDFKEIKNYSADVEYTIKNARGEIDTSTKQFYDKDNGMRVEFGQDRVQIYKGDKIIVKELASERMYDLHEDFDKFYKLAFVDELSKMFINDEEFKYYYEDIEGKRCLIVEFNTLNGNENMQKCKLWIDAKLKNPIKLLVYDKKGNERGEIKYENFSKKGVEKELFEIS